ncbi:MAG: hypothetical protein AAF657_12350 [Acidobacteriota bacterium]
MTRSERCLLLGCILCLAGIDAQAQFVQYNPPGTFEEKRESTEELLERSIKEARWRWGRFYAHPWIGIRNITYVDPVTGVDGVETTDFTASVGAGVRAYMPVGSELTLAIHALPEYVWWRDLSERRRINGRYGVGLFGNLGRTGLELSATRNEDARIVSREVEEQANIQDDVATASLEVDIGHGFAAFASGTLRSVSFREEASQAATSFAALERDEQVLRAGIKVELPRGLTVGIGLEDAQVDFTQAPDRSLSGTSPILLLDYDAERFYLEAELAARDLEPDSGSRSVPYDDITGSFKAAWRFPGGSELQFFGAQNLVYSLNDRTAYFEDVSVGLGFKTNLTSQLSLRLFAQDGTNDYVDFEPAPVPRSDDYQAYGLDLRLALGRFTLSLGASQTDYDSNLPQFDRETTTIRSGLTLGLGGSPWG